jgi:hypothetical protein
MLRKVRNYEKIINEIINMTIPFRIEILDYIRYEDEIYPMITIKSISKLAKKNVIITAGQHGDEYFAVHTLLRWMQQIKIDDYNDFNIYIYPIVNPTGYVYNKRTNKLRQDTNNDINFVKDSKVQELAILYDKFPSSANLILDIHGDTGKEQVYMYEHKPENLPSIAEKVLIENDNLIPYLKQKTIYKIPVNNGVIIPPKCDIGIEGVMEKLGVEYTMTLELPGKFDGLKRMVGGVSIINSILRQFKELK